MKNSDYIKPCAEFKKIEAKDVILLSQNLNDDGMKMDFGEFINF